MARYTGPRVRILRRLGCELPGLTAKSAARRPTAPGQAAATSKRFPKLSEFGQRMKEKQKLRYHYGLNERQLRRFYAEAARLPGDTGRTLINLLESRLDNLVWRAGLARTVPAARQLIVHGHVEIGGRRARTPSQLLSIGDSFQVRAAARNREDIRVSVNSPVLERPAGIVIDLDQLKVSIEALPSMEQMPIEVDVQKVIEFYSR